jgi:hypothetical protein
MNLVTIHCPHCGRELNIPEDAGNIVCMFCARPIDAQTVRLASMQPETATKIQNLGTLLPDALFTERLNPENFSAAKYPEEYECYLEQFRPALEAFRQNASDDPGAAEEFARLIFRRFQDRIQGPKGKHRDSFAFRLTITALTIPSILSLETAEAGHAVDSFLEQWNRAFPREHLGKATYEQILGGFHHKMCYITTAVCGSLGAGDDCAELNEFRSFRDSWLAHAPDGRAKITEYYLFAPMIVRAIDGSGQARTEYSRIWTDYLSPLLLLLRAGQQEDCASGYEKMVRSLERKWLP